MTAIRVELQLADGSFTSGMLRAGQTVEGFRRQLLSTSPELRRLEAAGRPVIQSMQLMDGSTKTFLSTLRDVSVVAGVAALGVNTIVRAANGWAGSIIRVNAEMEKLTFQMRAMSTAADPIKDAADTVKYLRQQATMMPFSMKAITNSFVKLKATGTDPMNGSLQAIADGIAAFGGSDEAFNRTVVGITQAAGKGVLQMEELRQQIGESMPNAMRLLARSMGVTVGQLAKEIATGTVAAGPALQKLYDELNRVYGGTALRMMQTFSGQLTQLHTNIQNLSTNEGGSGFFDQVKTQLQDINMFLASDMANKMATSFGNGLASMVAGMRSGVSMVWEFREELTRLGTALAAGVGFVALSRGLTSLIGSLGAARVAIAGMTATFAQANSMMALGATGATATGTALLGLQYRALAVTTAIRGVAIGMAGIAPFAVALGLAVWGAGEYFGLFSNKVDDAYESLKKFGSQSAEEAKKITDNKIKQLQEQLRILSYRYEFKDGIKFELDADGDIMSDLPDLKPFIDELKKTRLESKKLVEETIRTEATRELEVYKRTLSETTGARQREYDKLQLERDKRYQEDLDAAQKHGTSIEAVEQEYQKQLLAHQVELSNSKLRIYDNELTKVRELSNSTNEIERRKAEEQLEYLTKLRLEEGQANIELNRKVFSVDKNSGNSNEQAQATERAREAIEKLKVEIAGLQANIDGSSSAVAKMNERIAQGDFGSIKAGGEEVKKLHEELLAAAAAKDALDKVMRGRQKAETDLAKIEEDLAEREMKLQEKKLGREISDIDRFQRRLMNGEYFGLGPYENVKKAIDEVVGSINAQGEAAANTGAYMRDHAFGTETIEQIDSVTAAIARMRDAITGVGTGLTSLNFSQLGENLTGQPGMLGRGFTGTITSGTNLMSKNMSVFGDPRTPGWKDANITSIQANNGMTVQVHKAAADAFKGFLNDLVGTGYKIKSLGGFNVRNKVNGKGLSEHAFGNAIDINPAQNPYGKNLITDMPSNIRELANKWNLSWGGDWKSVKDAMHFEWRGGQVNTPAQTAAPAQQQATNVPSFAPVMINDGVNKTNSLFDRSEELRKREYEVSIGESTEKVSDWIKKTNAETDELGQNAEKAGTRYTQLTKAIADGEFDPGNGDPEDRNPRAKRFEAALAAARAYDEKLKSVNEREKLTRQTDQEKVKIEEQRIELNRRIAEMQNKVKDPKYVPDSQELQRLQTDMDAYVSDMLKLANGNINDAGYKQALETRRQLINGQRQLEALDAQVAFNKETESLRQSLMTQSQLRQHNLQQALAGVDTWLQKQIANGANEVEAVRMAEEQKALIRAKYAQETSPMGKQMAEWGDLQGQLAQKSTQWMDSLAGGITDLIMGTGDLRSAIQGILKDMVNMGVKYLMSGMFNKNSALKPQAAGKGGKGAKGAAGSIATKGKVPFMAAHTGGIAGIATGLSRRVSPSVFAGAPKFHTGGVVGGGLLPSEVPIIAQKGEGIFTPEQMDAMGGFQQVQQFNFNSPITVNGSAGTPEQNDDLAKRMAREYQTAMRGMVADELRRQTKAGNFLNQRSR